MGNSTFPLFLRLELWQPFLSMTRSAIVASRDTGVPDHSRDAASTVPSDLETGRIRHSETGIISEFISS